ncbi:MAG TPA: hypothetical protein ENI51_10610 [Candidatus Atribacteria bacterium]|nr:hypothetical protein [Candidatus Atribacteria bacterium]
MVKNRGNFLCGRLGILKTKRLLLLSFFILIACRCTTVPPVKGPNVSVLYRIPTLKKQLPPLADTSKPLAQKSLPEAVQHLFKRLYALNPTLALEVGRLPEFQGNVDERRIHALNRFVNLIENATQPQKANLAKLLKVGKPASRRYCTPLQAIFWILERGKPRSGPTVQEIEYFQLAKIGNRAGINPLKYRLEELLAQAWDFSEQDRWNDYEMVTDRLNAPELVNYYQRVRFIYKSKKGGIDNPYAYVGKSQKLFETNKGNCMDVSAFTAYCLKKAGYKVWEDNVHPTGYHRVCFFKMNGNKYVIDNGRPDKFLRRGIIPSKEYRMYHDLENIKKGRRGTHKDPVFWLQDNYALDLIYLIENDSRRTSVKIISEDLGIPRFEKNVRRGIKTLVNLRFISVTPYQNNKFRGFTYKLNNALCKRFLMARYHKEQNKYPWIDHVNRGYYSSLK